MKENKNNTNTMEFLEKSVLGFDDGNSIFMTFKELVDNATDACINNVDGRIHVDINECDGYEIVVSDNGQGLEPSSIESIGIMFVSVKSNILSIGRFGLGLKSILQCTKYIKFITKTTEQNGISFKLALDNTYQPYVYNVKEMITCNWSTVVSVYINSNVDISVVIKSILGYLKMLSYLHPGIKYSIRHGENIYEYHIAEKTPLERISTLINDVSVISKFNKNDRAGSNDAINITAGLFGERVDCRYGSCVIFTSVNGMPLLSKYSKPCSIYAGFNKFIENDGHEFGIFPTKNSPKMPYNFVCGLENIANIINLKLPEDRYYANLFMIINVAISEPKFGDLAKTHIKNIEVEERVQASCMDVMKQLKSKVGEYELESQSNYKTRMGLFYSKQLSHNIASIFNHSGDEFKARISSLLKSKGINYNNINGLEISLEKKINGMFGLNNTN